MLASHQSSDTTETVQWFLGIGVQPKPKQHIKIGVKEQTIKESVFYQECKCFGEGNTNEQALLKAFMLAERFSGTVRFSVV